MTIYALAGASGEMPVEEKGQLAEAAREGIDDLRSFCLARDVDLDVLGRLSGFALVAAGKEAVEMMMVDDDERIAFSSRAALVNRLYKAILPDVRANEFSRVRAVAKFLVWATRHGWPEEVRSSETGNLGWVAQRGQFLREAEVSVNKTLGLYD